MKTETQLAGKRETPVSERRIPFRARAWRPARAQHALPAPGVRRALSYQRPWPRACAAWHRRIECKAVFLSVHTVFPFCFYLRRLDGPRPSDGSSVCTRVVSATPVVRVRLGDDSSGSARVLSMTTEVREGLLASAAGLLISTRTTALPGEERVTLWGSWGALTGFGLVWFGKSPLKATFGPRLVCGDSTFDRGARRRVRLRVDVLVGAGVVGVLPLGVGGVGGVGVGGGFGGVAQRPRRRGGRLGSLDLSQNRNTVPNTGVFVRARGGTVAEQQSCSTAVSEQKYCFKMVCKQMYCLNNAFRTENTRFKRKKQA